MSYKTKIFWKKLNINYVKTWSSYARFRMAKREFSFISKYLKISQPLKILDIGVGTGRILEHLIKSSSSHSKIYGIDYEQKMVEFCQKKFRNYKKIQDIKLCDISKKSFVFNNKFDFITAIRVLKYNKNWPDIIKRIKKILEKNGIFIFTMPNSISINRFVKHKIPIYRSSATELKTIMLKNNYKLLEISSFSKLPDICYDNCLRNNYLYVNLLIIAERVLEFFLGKVFLGRILFIAGKKK